jgi:hypothetical protein
MASDPDSSARSSVPLLDNAANQYEFYTDHTSTVVRSLAITAVGVVWLLAGGLTKAADSPEAILAAIHHDDLLFWAFNCAVGALAADLVQYILSAIAWGVYGWSIDQGIVQSNTLSGARSWCAWQVIHLYRLARHLEREGGLPSPGPNYKWPARRAALRTALRAQPRPEWLQTALQDSWAPASINRLPLLIFLAKIGLTASAYGLVLAFSVGS